MYLFHVFNKIRENVFQIYATRVKGKLQISYFAKKKNKLLMKILKGKCPNIDPCGMPLKISLQSLNVEFILIYCVLLYLRTFLIKLINEIKHVGSCVVFENHTKFL